MAETMIQGGDRWAIPMLLGVVVAILMPYRVLPIPGFLPEAAAVLLASLGGAIAIILSRRADGVVMGWAPWTCIGFAGWLVVSVGINPTPYPDTLVFPVASLLVAALVAHQGTCVQQQGRSYQACYLLSWMWISASLGTCLIQWFQLLHPNQLEWWALPRPSDMQAFGNLAQRNHAACVHAMALLSLAYLGTTAQRRPYALAAAVVVLAGLVMTGSRVGSLLGAVAALAAVSIQRDPPVDSGRSRLKVARQALLALALYGVAYAALQHIIFQMSASFGISSAGTRWATYGNQPRLVLQEFAFALFRSQPLTGTGWGTFSAQSLMRVDELTVPQYANNSHNLVTQLAAETGLVGVLLVVPPICWIMRDASKRQPQGWIYAGAMCLMFLVYSMTEFPLWNTFFLFPFAYALGLLDRRIIALSLSQSMRLLCAVSLIVIAAGTLWAGHRYLILAGLANAVFKGGAASTQLREQAAFYGNSPGFSPQTELLAFGLIHVDSNQLPEKIELGNRVVRQYIDAFLLEKQAALLALAGRDIDAAAYLHAACRFYPEKCDDVSAHLDRLVALQPATFAPVKTRLDALKSQDQRASQRQSSGVGP